MSYNFVNLDEITRKYMIEEVEFDIQRGFLYKSYRFNKIGNNIYPQILKDAIKFGNEQTLEKNLLPEYFLEKKDKDFKIGKYVLILPKISNKVFSEYEFNKFYMRAILRRAMVEKKKVAVYQAKTDTISKFKTIAGFIIENPSEVLKKMQLGFKLEASIGLPLNQRYYGLSLKLLD